MLPQVKQLQEILAQNAELTARLKLSNEQLRKLQQEQAQLERLKDEKQRLSERVMLLQEEVRWYKEQFFGGAPPRRARRRSPRSRSCCSTRRRSWRRLKGGQAASGCAASERAGKGALVYREPRPKLALHLEHPEVPADNNYLENQIRPFAQGRRAWLFAHNPYGAKASANLYSLVSCARVNGLEPYAYLVHLLEELPKASTADALEALLPWNAKPVLQARRAA